MANNGNRDEWGVAWLMGSLVTLVIFTRVFKVWHTFDSWGKLQSGFFLAALVVFPAGVILQMRRGRPLSVSRLVFIGYLVLMLAINTFSH